MTLKYVQIETTTSCTQRCYFCPVSDKKRPKKIMPLDVLDRIISELKSTSLEAVYINGFNEPTFDKQIITKVKKISEAGFKVHLNTNASGLTPDLSDLLIKNGVSSFTINLSSLDNQVYFESGRGRHLDEIIANIEYLLKVTMNTADIDVSILVLGHLDRLHSQSIEDIKRHFDLSHKVLSICPIANYAGSKIIAPKQKIYHEKIHGCISRRHKDWLHFTASGNVISCCQDYIEDYRIGNIQQNTIAEILKGDLMLNFQEQVDGKKNAPDDFICRSCVFALGDADYSSEMNTLFCEQCELIKYSGDDAICENCVIYPHCKKIIRSSQ